MAYAVTQMHFHFSRKRSRLLVKRFIRGRPATKTLLHQLKFLSSAIHANHMNRLKQLYAPGYYTGYGVKTLPGIREAIEQRFWKEAQENIGIVAKTIQGYTEQVKAANAILK